MKYPTPKQLEVFFRQWESLGNYNISDRERFQKVTGVAHFVGYETAYREYKNQFPVGIRDRRPKRKDGDAKGYVQVYESDLGVWSFEYWNNVDEVQIWMHTPKWKPKTEAEIVDEAIALIDGHSTVSLKVSEVQTVLEALMIAKGKVTEEKQLANDYV